MNQTTNGSTTSLNIGHDNHCQSFEDINRSCDTLSNSSSSDVIPYGIFMNVVAINCGLTPLIGLVGIFGNVLTLAVLKREKKVTPMLVLQITVTVCDLMFLIFKYPYCFYVCGHCLYQDFIEKLTAYVPSHLTSMIVRSLRQSGRANIVLLAIDRAISICFPLSTFITLRRTYLAIAGVNCIILGSLMHDIALFSLAHNEIMTTGGYGKTNMFSMILESRAIASRINKPYVAITKLVLKVAFEILPVILVSVCNLAISRGLAKNAKSHLKKQDEAARTRKERNAKINRTLFIITCSFVLLCLPGELYALFIFFFGTSQAGVHVVVSAYVNVLILTNHTINFFIYCFSNKTYQKIYMEIICCKKPDG